MPYVVVKATSTSIQIIPIDLRSFPNIFFDWQPQQARFVQGKNRELAIGGVCRSPVVPTNMTIAPAANIFSFGDLQLF